MELMWRDAAFKALTLIGFACLVYVTMLQI